MREELEDHFRQYLDQWRADRGALNFAQENSAQSTTSNNPLAKPSVDPTLNVSECATLTSEPPHGQILEIHCQPDVGGRYVTIMKIGASGEPLRLCEVQVFGILNDTVPITEAPFVSTTEPPTDPPTMARE